MVGRPAQRSCRGRESLPEVQEGQEFIVTNREGSGGLPGGLGRVEKPSWRVERGREGSRGPPRGPGVVGRSSLRPGMGREALPKVRKALTKVWQGLGSPPNDLVGVRRPSRWFERGRDFFM